MAARYGRERAGRNLPVAIALWAFIPETSERILEALGQPADLAWEGVAGGRTIAADGIEPAAPLFPRVDAPTPA